MTKCIVSKWQSKDGANTLSPNGLIRINDNKPDYGSMMLITPNVITIDNGFMNKRNIVGFIAGSVEDLNTMIEAYDLKDGDDYSVKVAPHRIVTLEITLDEFPQFRSNAEHTKPEESGFREKKNPTTDEVLCTADGDVIFWKTEIVAEGSSVVTKTIKHTRTTVADPAVAEFAGEPAKETKK